MEDRLHVSPDNRSMLVAYCVAWAQFVKAQRVLEAAGGLFFTTSTGYESPHPAVAVANKAEERFVKLAKDLGFAPQTRETIDPVAQPDEKSEAEEWEERRPDTLRLIPFSRVQR